MSRLKKARRTAFGSGGGKRRAAKTTNSMLHPSRMTTQSSQAGEAGRQEEPHGGQSEALRSTHVRIAKPNTARFRMAGGAHGRR